MPKVVRLSKSGSQIRVTIPKEIVNSSEIWRFEYAEIKEKGEGRLEVKGIEFSEVAKKGIPQNQSK